MFCMKKIKRILSLVLAVCSIMSLMAVSTFASGPQDGVITCQILFCSYNYDGDGVSSQK